MIILILHPDYVATKDSKCHKYPLPCARFVREMQMKTCDYVTYPLLEDGSPYCHPIYMYIYIHIYMHIFINMYTYIYIYRFVGLGVARLIIYVLL